jgi:N-acetylmuramoyl-L-alanine amidase
VITQTQVVVPVVTDDGDGTYLVETPCSDGSSPRTATVRGTPLYHADIVLDPGHGGDESGAVGPTGLIEKDVNLAVAEDVQGLLEAQGHSVAMTRVSDVYSTLSNRAKIATGLAPEAFISIHHNADPDGPTVGPGDETYFQIASRDSKRLAGLIWEEITAAFAPFGSDWVGDTDHGAKYRQGTNGDYYGILRLAAGTVTVLSEAAFITNPAEEALLRTPEFRHAEARAIATAVQRYLTTDAPGSGFTDPYPRTTPATGGNGGTECVDPPL